MLKQRYRNKRDLYTYMVTRCKCIRSCYLGLISDISFSIPLDSELLLDAAQALPPQFPAVDTDGAEEVPAAAGRAEPPRAAMAAALGQAGLTEGPATVR